jgi:hypothetical protein
MMRYRYPTKTQLDTLSEALVRGADSAEVLMILFPAPVDKKQHQWKHYVEPREAAHILPRECQKCGLYVYTFCRPDRTKYDTMWIWKDGRTRQQPKPHPTPKCDG